MHVGFKRTGTGEVGIHPLDSVRMEVFRGSSVEMIILAFWKVVEAFSITFVMM